MDAKMCKTEFLSKSAAAWWKCIMDMMRGLFPASYFNHIFKYVSHSLTIMITIQAIIKQSCLKTVLHQFWYIILLTSM